MSHQDKYHHFHCAAEEIEASHIRGRRRRKRHSFYYTHTFVCASSGGILLNHSTQEADVTCVTSLEFQARLVYREFKDCQGYIVRPCPKIIVIVYVVISMYVHMSGKTLLIKVEVYHSHENLGLGT